VVPQFRPSEGLMQGGTVVTLSGDFSARPWTSNHHALVNQRRSMKSGEIIIASVNDLYLCPEGHVSNNSRECPLCQSQVISLAALVNREEDKEKST
jgi:hypothetical protein